MPVQQHAGLQHLVIQTLSRRWIPHTSEDPRCLWRAIWCGAPELQGLAWPGAVASSTARGSSGSRWSSPRVRHILWVEAGRWCVLNHGQTEHRL